jgi:hypothetical protein
MATALAGNQTPREAPRLHGLAHMAVDALQMLAHFLRGGFGIALAHGADQPQARSISVSCKVS